VSQHAIVIGGGHNGLVAAAYLGRAGIPVMVLERRSVLGGACVTEELVPGARFSTCAYVVSSLRPQIIRELELERHGLDVYATDVLDFLMKADGQHLFLWPELDRTLAELGRHSERDAAAFPDFGLRLRRFARIVEPYLLSDPPALSELVGRFEAAGEIELWHEFVTQSVGDLVDGYFDNDLLKGAFIFFGLVAVWAGPYSPGTAYEFSHHSWGEYKGEFGRFGFARGGMGAITQALAAAAREAGAEIQTGVPVRKVLVRNGVAHGVELEDGERLEASLIVSNVDPRRTFLELFEADDVPGDLRRRAAHIDMRGTMARVHLLVDRLPEYTGLPAGEGPQHRGFTLLGGTVDEYERCWRAQQEGELVDDYPIELTIQSTTDSSLAPAGMHTVTTGIQQLPFTLATGDWDSRREEFTERVVRSLARFAPNIESSIRGSFTLTPLDLEREYGLSGGNIFHGAMTLNQLFASRPTPSLGQYRTPVRNFYLCGAGTHPGGAVMGAAGHNAARAILREQQGGARPSQVRGRRPRRPLHDMTASAVDRLASAQRLRGIRNWALRQPWLRPAVKRLSRR
jgi:phytoene dehydrogenase-like protein